MTRNTNPNEGGPGGGQLEAKVGAFYFLCMLAESEPRGLPGCTATKVKFQRTYEEHALDDVIVIGESADGEPQTLEIQSKRTLDFTASDAAFGKVIAQVVRAGEGHTAPIAVAIARTSAKIERHYHQLLQLARKCSSAAALRGALDASRVANQGMRDFAAAVGAQIAQAGGEADDETVWRLLRRFEILVFDFESPGAISNLLVESLCRLVLTETDVSRHGDLWDALLAKALSYDADGGEITRTELVDWLRSERGLELRPGRELKTARRRFGDASDAALEAIDDTIAGFRLDRSDRVLAVAEQLESARFVEIVGGPGCGKSAILKALAERERMEGRPLVLTPARTPSGGWLTLSAQIGFRGSPPEFLTEMAASGCSTLFIDSLDRFTDPGVQATIVDLIRGAAKVPGLRVAASVGPDFSEEQRQWLPAGAIAILGRTTAYVGELNDDEAVVLAAADRRLAQLLNNPQAKPLARSLYQLRQLLGRSEEDLPLSEAALARSWWMTAPGLDKVRNRARQMALRDLAGQVLAEAAELDISRIDPKRMEDLVQAEDVTEIFMGAKGLFRHDILRDWAGANLLIEQPERLETLPLAAPAPTGLARALEVCARWRAEQTDGAARWVELLALVSRDGAHGSWRRGVLLALVRSEQYRSVLDRMLDVVQAEDGRVLCDLIRITEAAESRSGADLLPALGIDAPRIPPDFRTPTGPSWTRLMGWLLGRFDQFSAPVGPDLLRFFRLWLMAFAGRDVLAPYIVEKLYDWLIGLEEHTRQNEAAFNVLFASKGRIGRRREIEQDIRMLFLIFCGSRPDLADAYLRRHIGEGVGRGVADEILQLPQTIAAAAPAAMADFTIDAMVSAEQRAGRLAMGRLSLRPQQRLTCGPSSGPYLAVLRASPPDGLRLVRRIVDYGLGLDNPRNKKAQQFGLDLPAGAWQIVAPGAYFAARSPGENGVVTSALRALEAWGHEQIDQGRLVEDVLADVLGEAGSPISAPFLAVAVDLLLSHLSAPDPRLIPFIASPELLKLDFDRFNRDRTGVDQLGWWGNDGALGPGSNADLRERRSRQTCLQLEAPRFLLSEDESLADELRSRLQGQLERLDEGPNAEASDPHNLRWVVEHVLKLLDRANWRAVEVQLEDGSTITGLDYVEPASEAAVMEPLRASSNAEISETVTMLHAVQAALDPAKATAEVLARGLEWARRQELDALRETDDDFSVAQRWRAVVAVAVLVARSADHADAWEWAAKILYRAGAETSRGNGTFEAPQVQYNAPGLAVLGLARLTINGELDALRLLLELATRTSPPVVGAFGLVLEELIRWRAECPAALLRLAIDASIFPTRDWDQPERFEADEALRSDRLRARRSEEEQYLLGSGLEPAWPEPPATRHMRKSLHLPGFEECDDIEEARDVVLDRFNDQLAGAWLTLLERSPLVERSDLPRRVTELYRTFSNFLWGRGLEAHAEVTELPMAWLGPFARLRLRAVCGLTWDEFSANFVEDLLAIPDQGFLGAVEVVFPLADGLALADERLPMATLVRFRETLFARLKRCHDWEWRKDEVSDSIAHDLAGAVRALFVHSPYWFGLPDVGKSRLPETAQTFAAIFPALVDLAVDAPGLSYVAALMMNDFERGRDWVPIELFVQAAEGWLKARSGDTEFWRDHGFGRRVCAWLAGRVDGGMLVGAELTARVQTLIDRLAEIGVPEALALEPALGPV